VRERSKKGKIHKGVSEGVEKMSHLKFRKGRGRAMFFKGKREMKKDLRRGQMGTAWMPECQRGTETGGRIA